MKSFRVVLWLLAFAAAALPLHALTLKVGSLAPANTPWDAALHQLSDKWKEISGGTIQLKIYPGGIAGNEADMIRKMRIGQLDGAALSGTGLNRISSQLLALSLPLFYQSYAEVEYVMQKMTPTFTKLVAAKGVKLIALSTAGWIHFFSRKPIEFPDDLRAQKLAVTAEDQDILYAWRAMGFDALPLHLTEILAGLQTGMADAYHTSPLVAAVYQWFAITPYMSALKVAPLPVGFVMGDRSWDKIPEQYRQPFIDATKGILKPLYQQVEVEEQKAITVMKENGLKVTPISNAAMQAWLGMVDKGYKILESDAISPQIFNEVKMYRDEYRKAHSSN